MLRKHTIIKRLLTLQTTKIAQVGIVVVCLVLIGFSIKIVHAVDSSTINSCSAQEQALQQQNSQNQSNLGQLQITAGSYQNAGDN